MAAGSVHKSFSVQGQPWGREAAAYPGAWSTGKCQQVARSAECRPKPSIRDWENKHPKGTTELISPILIIFYKNPKTPHPLQSKRINMILVELLEGEGVKTLRGRPPSGRLLLSEQWYDPAVIPNNFIGLSVAWN